VRARHRRSRRPWPIRVLRLLAAAAIGLVLGVGLDVALARVGLFHFGPSLSGDVALARSGRPGIRVLFVGNSFTFSNDMPELVHRLAAADPEAAPIYAVEYTAAGWRLKAAAYDRGLYRLLHEIHWDEVVLQEQSRIPSLEPVVRARETDPYARSLVADVRTAGAKPMFFMTWGYKHGDDVDLSGDTFGLMQGRLEYNYDQLGAELAVPVAPVGRAWALAHRLRPRLELWQGDGGHPSRTGSYLAACVFYAVLEHRDPTASRFRAGLPRDTVRFLARVAARVTHR
jgi:hypothetical protein